MHPFYIILLILLIIFVVSTVQIYRKINPEKINQQWVISFLSSAMLVLGLISYSIHEEIYSVGMLSILLFTANVVVVNKHIRQQNKPKPENVFETQDKQIEGK